MIKKSLLYLFFYFSLYGLKAQTFKFSKDFLWCSATAAHQIEGNNINSDWWQWEQKKGAIKNNERSGIACDHWNRVDEDIALMKNLNLNAYRFSLSWSKIEPKEGFFDELAIDHYKEEINKLLEKNIEPIVTLHHFVHPHWFTSSGGWYRDDAVEIFKRFLHKVYSSLGSKVKWWTTINEPMVLIGGGYIEGLMPPGRKDFSIKKPLVNLMKTHAMSYQYLHKKAEIEGRKIYVGLAHHIRFLEASRKWNPLDIIASKISNWIFNYMIPEALATGEIKLTIPFVVHINEKIEGLKNTQDYIGLNYYTRELIEVSLLDFQVKRKYHKDKLLSDLNWEHYPQGLAIITQDYSKLFPKIPFLITENGVADSKDWLRKQFIKEHLEQIEKLEAQGHQFLGYCYWSLMDNFEWIEGFSPRFGLYEMDYKTQTRKLRPSAKYFKQLILNHHNFSSQEVVLPPKN